MAQQTKRHSQKRSYHIDAKILYSGVLMKRGEYHNQWKERWFVLFDNRTLSYYHNREEFSDSRRPIQMIDLRQVTAIQPVNASMHQSPPKKQKKSGFFSSKSSSDIITHSQSLPYSVNHTHSEKFADSPIPSIQTSQSLQSSNSLRKSFKSLMGKKKHTIDGSNMSSLSVDAFEDVNDEYSMTSRGDSFHSELSDAANIFNAEFPFEIVTPSRTYLLCSIDAYSFNDWLEHLQNITFGKKIYGGWLTKQGSKNKSWKKRWFVIYDTREIRYYESDKTKIEKGSIILDDLQIMNLLEDKLAKGMYKKKNVFELVCGGRKWVLVSNSKEERVKFHLCAYAHLYCINTTQ